MKLNQASNRFYPIIFLGSTRRATLQYNSLERKLNVVQLVPILFFHWLPNAPLNLVRLVLCFILQCFYLDKTVQMACTIDDAVNRNVVFFSLIL